MTSKHRKAIVISASSDIGWAIVQDWCKKDWTVFGTYRQMHDFMKPTGQADPFLIPCDILDVKSIDAACADLARLCAWDVLLIAPARQEPVGRFHEVDFDEWEEGVQVNLLRQLRILHRLLPHRGQSTEFKPTVMFFAGGGTNNSVDRYSSYTLSKIALIKMCELLDTEMPDVRFVIVGPGWVKTKGHLPTLKVGASMAGANYEKTLLKLASDDCTPMADVVGCCNWLIETQCDAVSGRNFSVVFDQWGSPGLEAALKADIDMYKLRRSGNMWGR